MRFVYRAMIKKENKRRLLAALFMFVFLAEAGSHAAICADHSSSGERSVSASENGSEDPCKTLILCSDGKQKDQQLPKLRHDSSQHNALFDPNRGIGTQAGTQKEPKIPFGTAHCLFRPKSPPFQPPKTS